MKDIIKLLIAVGIGVAGYNLIYNKGYDDAIKAGKFIEEFKEKVLNEAKKES